MRKKILTNLYLFLLLAVSQLLSNGAIEFAPLNPDFMKDSATVSQDIISPAPLSLPSALYSSAPSSLDLRSYRKVTPVKDQGVAGSCWAFATYSSLESYLLSNNKSMDFSENHMKNILSSSYAEGFDRKASDGGNHFISTAYLVRWSGPISEFEDPYNASSSSSPENLQPVKHVQEVVFLPDRKNSLDNNAIKQAVMKYGAIYTTMYYNNSYLAKGKNYYYSGSSISNHAVSIVGWIDNYSRTNFYGSASGIPPGDGAFIVKNSWGTLWGESGYFYISYYDTNIGKNCAVFNNAEPVDNYNQIYQYDPLGWVTSSGFGNDMAYFANIFTANQSGLIQAVGFYTPVLNSQYEVRIYKNKNVSDSSPVDGTLQAIKSGTIPDPGYHTIKLPADVLVSKNERFSAVVRLKTPCYNYPIPMEVPITGYSSKATADAGQSFVSDDGLVWRDPTQSRPGSNVCIKVYGTAFGLEILSPNGGEQWEQGSTKTIIWRYAGNIKGNLKLELLKNDRLSYVIASGLPIGRNGIGSYQWKIPVNIAASEDYKIRISNNLSNIADSSDSAFSIISGRIVVENPSSGASFSRGTNQLIQWKSYGNTGGLVKIELLKSGRSVCTIVSNASANTNSTGSFIWKVPLTLIPGNDYSIKVVSATNPEIYGLSQPFTIVGPSINLTSPAAGEIWYTGTLQEISWTYTGIYPVYAKIECLNGASSFAIAQVYVYKNTGSYLWNIPSTLRASNDYRIRITAINDSF
ncbi:MAG: lectin like domain-containing protein, partial [Candidatus Omnitrophica bacterium]|nr:lectin like domain-containing protein [Candidatus Omnitrophota bacterium]